MRPLHDDSESRLAADVERALDAFRRGSPEALERLVCEGDESGPPMCALLGEILEVTQWEDAHRIRPPERAGEYQLGRLIGRGGMAVVYEARQLSTGRTVALKLMLPGSGVHAGDVRLHEREIRLLGRLKHPNIATLFDAGRIPDGRSYFAMELVEGRSLSEVHAGTVDAEGGFRSGEGRRRIELLRDVCRAMGYAHQRGVIHCDLKPTNILVDGDGRAKILDFGLAKMLDPDASLASVTRDRNRIAGTVAYMSPEQARGASDEIDTRTDAYSLGVILYELLTGRRPYDLKGMPFPRALQMICTSEPVRPSQIDRRLAGDLEIISLKALQKDPRDRYQSPDALADDLERYLDRRPILARPPSEWYQFVKLMARHRVVTALLVLLAAVLTVSAVVFIRQAAVVARERDHAREQAARKERVNAFLTKMLASLDARSVGRRISVEDVLNQASACLEAEFSDQPEVRSTLEDTIGRGYLALVRFGEAKSHLAAALDIRRNLYGESNAEYASALHQLGLAENGCGEHANSRKHILLALEIRRNLFGDRHLDVAESLLDYPTDTLDVRIEKCREAVAIQREILGECPELALSLVHTATFLVRSARDAEAEPLLTEALAIQERFLGRDHIDIARTLIEMGDIAVRRGELEEAERLHREQIRILEPIFLPDGSKELIQAYTGLGEILDDRGRIGEAERFYVVAYEMETQIFGKSDSALTKNNYGSFLTRQGRYAEALPHLKDVYRSWHSASEGLNPGEGYASQNLGHLLLEMGCVGDARSLFEEADRAWTALFDGKHPKQANALIGLGRCALHSDDLDLAQTYFNRAHRLLSGRLGEENWETHRAAIWLGWAMQLAGNDDGAALCARSSLAIERLLGRRHAETAFGRLMAGRACALRGESTKAEAAVLEAIEIERSIDRKDHPDLAAALFELAKLEAADGRRDDARAHATEALRILELRLGDADGRTCAVRVLLDGLLGR